MAEYDVAAIADQVEPERERVHLVGEYGIREQLRQNPLRRFGERVREVHDVAVVERGERHVEVVEARVDQPQRYHGPAEHLLRLGVGGGFGTEPVSGEDQPAVRVRYVGEV